MRLGDLDALSKKMFYVEEKQGGHGWVVSLEDIAHAPTIDPEELRPKGEWTKNSNGRTCDQCKFVYYSCHKKGFNYCPNCGAQMKGINSNCHTTSNAEEKLRCENL